MSISAPVPLPLPRDPSPPLDDIRQTLAEFVRRHSSWTPERYNEIDVAGKIDPNEPEAIQEFRRQLRRKGRQYSTEKVYVKWANQFIERYDAGTIARLQAVGEAEVTEFLTEVAVERNVTLGTQKQAFNALIKLFEFAARKELRGIDAVRANKPRKLPLVLRTYPKTVCGEGDRHILLRRLRKMSQSPTVFG